MDLVEIHVVHLQPAQAVVNGVVDVLAREAALVQVITHHSEDLGGHDEPVTRRPEVLEGTAQDLFADTERINVGGIEEVDAGFDGLTDERPAFLFLQHPFTPLPGTVSHAAQANTRNLYSARTEIDVFHSTLT